MKSAVVTSGARELVRRELTLEVPAGTLAATAVAAPDAVGPGLSALLFCVPGMTYRRSYYDLQIPGREGYSFAEAAAARGHVVVMIDNLGTGDSARPDDGGEVDLELLGASAARAGTDAAARVLDGSLIPELAALNPVVVVGIGHSMGGGVIVAAQGNHASFDAIAALGFTAQELAGIYEPAPNEDSLTFEERRDWARAHIPPKLWGRTWDELGPYFEIDRDPFRELFYAADVPEDVIAADTAAATVSPRQAALDIITPGLGAQFAARIVSPVFLAFGSVDLSPDPGGEVRAYEKSRDITLLKLADTAHCHNLASARGVLWKRLLGWMEALR
jgi:pimeloyl-ACP methyl ester carboxylesterase